MATGPPARPVYERITEVQHFKNPRLLLLLRSACTGPKETEIRRRRERSDVEEIGSGVGPRARRETLNWRFFSFLGAALKEARFIRW